MKLSVGIREIWERTVVVEAESIEEAIEQVIASSDTLEGEREFLRYMPPEEWPVSQMPMCEDTVFTLTVILEHFFPIVKEALGEDDEFIILAQDYLNATQGID